MQKAKGLTLIELLLVSGAAVTTVSVLSPVYNSNSAKAQQVKCLQNMKQVGSALMRYTDDNNGALPQAWTSGSWNSGTWRERIQTYLKDKNVLKCTCKSYQQIAGSGADAYSHYGMCAGLTHASLSRPGFVTPTGSYGFGFTYISKLQMPKQTLMLGENRDGDWSTEPLTDYPPYWSSGAGSPGGFYPYHLRPQGANMYTGGGNFVFCDGHAKFMEVNEAESYNPTAKTRTFDYWIADKSFSLPPLASGPNGSGT